MSLKIFYRQGQEPENYIDFDGDTLTIGRSTPSTNSVDLNLFPDSSVSRRHAALFFDRNRWWIRDLGSKQGTYYDGKPITVSTMIPSGGVVTLGTTCLRLEYDDSGLYVVDSEDGVVTEVIDAFGDTHKVTESGRLEMLGRIANINSQYGGQTALDMLAHSIRELFGKKADRVGVILYRDKQSIPVAFLPPEKSYVSFSLVENVIEKRVAFIWEKRSFPDVKPSLKEVITSMYAPISYNRRIIGVIHVDSISANVQFSTGDLEIFAEIARSSSLLLYEQSNILDFVPSVFISYSRTDQNFVKQLSSDLRRQVINVWYDDRLHAGEDWQKQLSQAISVMNICVLIMSPASLASKNVEWELDQARKAGKVILPVLYHLCDNIPEWLEKIHYVDFTKDPQRALYELGDAIRSQGGS